MPFTPSHAAAVLPLLRTPLPASALVIGSMAPDLPYYLPAWPGWQTHSVESALSTDVALGAAGWLLWHALLAAPVLAAAPAGVRRRLPDSALPGLRRRTGSVPAAALALLALAVGALTHVGWDAFSHPGRFGTDHLPPLSAQLGPLPGYSWAQHLSGLLGGAALVGWCARWWRRMPLVRTDDRPAPVRVWLAVLAVAGAAGMGAALLAPGLRAAAFDGATAGGGTLALVVAVLAAGWHLRRR